MKHAAARESLLIWQLPDIFKNRTGCVEHKKRFQSELKLNNRVLCYTVL
jgi:hypothetical protein